MWYRNLPASISWRRQISNLRKTLLQTKGIFGCNTKVLREPFGRSKGYLIDCYVYVEAVEFPLDDLVNMAARNHLEIDCDGEVIRGWISSSIRFRVQVCRAERGSLPVDGVIRHVAAPDIRRAEEIGGTCLRLARLGFHQWLDACHAATAKDELTARLHLTLCHGLAIQLASCLAWRSAPPSHGRLPFGSGRALVANMAPSGEMEFLLQSALRTLRGCVSAIYEFWTDLEVDKLLGQLAEASSRFDTKAPADDAGPPPFYDEAVARNYDRYRQFPQPIERQLAAIANEYAGTRVAELGAGTGRLALLFARWGARVSATDISASMLAELERRRRTCGIEGIKTYQTSMTQVPLESGTCDLLVEHEAFVFYPSPSHLANELDRLLSKGGFILRLISTTMMDRSTAEALAAFDRVVAASTVDGIVFVGEDVDVTLDRELRGREFGIEQIPLWRGKETARIEDLLQARRVRAFPYLSQTPDAVIELALRAAWRKRPRGPSTFESVYRLNFGWRRREHPQDVPDQLNFFRQLASEAAE